MPDQSSAATEHAILQEITGPLETLPDDPLAQVSVDFPTTLRGYDRMAVDDYVRQTRQLVAELQVTRSPESAVRRALERVGEQISGILQRAHETAEQITAQSRVEAGQRLDQARQEADRIAGSAEQRVRDLDADTDRIWLERQRIVADAEDLAAQLRALARTAAARFPEDAEPGAGGEQEAAPQATEPSFGVVDEEDDYYLGSDEPDIEETVAFRPLAPTGADDVTADTREESPVAPGDASPADEPETDPSQVAPGAEPASPEPETDPGQVAPGEGPAPPEPERDLDPPPPPAPAPEDRVFTADDTTAVIPPASQAASRRRSE